MPPTVRQPAAAAGSPTGPDPDAETGMWRAQYWIVLAMIVTSYTLCAVQTSPRPVPAVLVVQLITVGAIFRVAHVKREILRVTVIILTVAIIAVIVGAVSDATGHLLDIVLSIATFVAYLVAPMAIFRHQLRRRHIDGQTLLAAISAYLLVGMFFTFVYNAAALIISHPLFGPGTTDSLTSQLFFSFTTMTTTGYGNLVPVGPTTQGIAIAEAITGQLFLVIAVARVVTGWIPRDSNVNRGSGTGGPGLGGGKP